MGYGSGGGGAGGVVCGEFVGDGLNGTR
jgi:hypothetical protein